jgi:hypothetical protein
LVQRAAPGVIIAGLAAWLGKVWADRIAEAPKFASEIDLDLRKRRIDVYQELSESTAVLPKWTRASDVTYEQLLQLSMTLKDWYSIPGHVPVVQDAR